MTLAVMEAVDRHRRAEAPHARESRNVLLVSALIGALIVSPIAVRAQEDTTALFAFSPPASVRYNSEAITRRFPEMAGFDSRAGCSFVALVSDTAAAQDIREAFLPLVSKSYGTGCSDEVEIVPFPYSYAEIRGFQTRIGSLLAGSNTGGFAMFDPSKRRLIVRAKSTAGVGRAEARIRPDTSLPQDIIDIIPRESRLEADVPENPPAEAYVPILVHLYRQGIGSLDPKPTFGLLSHNLPEGFSERHLSGLDILLTDDRCSVDRAISIFPATQLASGAYVIKVLVSSPRGGMLLPTRYDVLCDGDECFLAATSRTLEDYGLISC